MKRSHYRGCEQGGILTLLALFAAIIVMFAVLIIDLSSYANHREQAEEYARLAALSALEAHFATNVTPDPNDPDGEVVAAKAKVQAALTRANNVSSSNVLLAERGTNGKLYSPVLLSGGQTGTGAELIPGLWLTTGPSGTYSCSSYPCFVPVNVNTNPTTQITAYQVRGSIYDKFSTKLARAIFNTAAFPVNVLATATVVPRRGCFIIDLSASETRDTHLLRSASSQVNNPIKGRGSEFVYALSTDNTGDDNIQDEAWQTVMSSSTPVRPGTTTPGSMSWAQFFNTTNDSGKTLANMTEQSYRTMHFRDDFVKKYVLSDSDYNLLKQVYDAKYDEDRYPFPHPNPTSNSKYEVNVGTGATDYRRMIHVDRFRNAGGGGVDGTTGWTYSGAEPLHSVFKGLNSAMQFFQQRQVAGDAACLMFVDSRLWYTRFVKMTDNFPYLIELTDFNIPSTAPMTDDDTSLKTSDAILTQSTSGFDLIVRHGLLPIGVGAATTNLSLAVSEALTELKSGNPSSFASNFITIISDGLSNCRPCNGTEYCPNNGYYCSNVYDNYRQAMNNLRNIARDQMQGKNISLNWIYVGDSVGPHTLNIDAGGNKCMSDEEARTQGVDMVRGKWDCNFSSASAAFSGMSAEHPFYQAAVIPYQIAVGTRGLWGPIRPLPSGTCTKTSCTGSISGSTSTSCTSSKNDGTRLFTDPECRTQEAQITDYMRRIIGDNPYTLVEAQ